MQEHFLLDTKYLYSPRVKFGITNQTMQATSMVIDEARQKVDQMLATGQLPFIEELKSPVTAQAISAAMAKYTWVEKFVIVGIGGSDLGARAIKEALGWEKRDRVIFYGDSTDPEQTRRLLTEIEPEKCLFVIVSKSGGTLETLSSYLLLKDICLERTIKWADHFLFLTDPVAGLLRKEAEANQIATLPIPSSVGGRFSVLTSVGLFPAAALGLDIVAMTEAALKTSQEMADTAFQIAALQFQLFQQGLPLAILMPYSVQLIEFARWYRQLWAESLGKNDTGIMPIQARGPADQHSQLQFYQSGKLMGSVWFIKVNERVTDYVLKDGGIVEAKLLAGRKMSELINIEQQATALGLAKAGRPSATLSVHSLNHQTLASLFMLFEMAVVYLAAMLNVDVFTQPGVEESKKMTQALLGNPDMIDLREEIRQLES